MRAARGGGRRGCRRREAPAVQGQALVETAMIFVLLVVLGFGVFAAAMGVNDKQLATEAAGDTRRHQRWVSDQFPSLSGARDASGRSVFG
jgi:Flp pilus assembly protein TadG